MRSTGEIVSGAIEAAQQGSAALEHYEVGLTVFEHDQLDAALADMVEAIRAFVTAAFEAARRFAEALKEFFDTMAPIWQEWQV